MMESAGTGTTPCWHSALRSATAVRLVSCDEGWEAAVAALGKDWVARSAAYRNKVPPAPIELKAVLSRGMPLGGS